MGVFDYLTCEAELPHTAVPPPGRVFQTKDTEAQYMADYTITADGLLIWRPFKMVAVPKHERPYPDATDYRAGIGSFKRVHGKIEVVDLTGSIIFYTGNHPDTGWWEYEAVFKDARLVSIGLVEFRLPGHSLDPIAS